MNRTLRRGLPLAAAFTIAACGGGGDSAPVTKSVALEAFSGPQACESLEAYIEDTLVTDMRTQLEAARDGVPGWGWWAMPALRAGVEGDPVSGTVDAAKSPTDFTTTNTQVSGVDEADFVKNDGTRIFVLSGNRMHAVRSWPASQLDTLGSIAIEGYPREMFLHGADRAVVFSTVYDTFAVPLESRIACLGLDCGYVYPNTVKVTEIDVSDLANPTAVREIYLPGNYLSARRIDGSVRIVLTSAMPLPPGILWSPPWDATLWADKTKLSAAYDALIAQNEATIRARTLRDWLPPARSVVAGVATEIAHRCDDFMRVTAPTRAGTATVATLDLASGSLSRTSILGEAAEVYASARNLYLATRHWWWWPEIGQEDTTYLHKFDISRPDRADYRGSGSVGGHIVDQFSLDESAAGHLRVVTTVQRRVPNPSGPPNAWGVLETAGRLTVLGESAGELRELGRTPDLAPGERVTSSRIVGDRGFVVTFRQVDPLFTLDLSDPSAPRVVGELKIPGFSTYMHPLDADHLLTIGTFVPEPPPGQPIDWRARALQLSIFDVSDLSAPRQTHTQLVGTAYGWSEAQFEHRAFNYFAARKLLAIPFSDWSVGVGGAPFWSTFTSELRVYGVDTATGFTPRGAITMNDLYQARGTQAWTYWWSPQVRRSVMADDFVYAVSDAGIRVADIADLSAPVGTTLFPVFPAP